MARISLYRYRIRGRSWQNLSHGQGQTVAQEADRTHWQGSEPERYGLKQCVTGNKPELAIAGYFTQEFPRPRLKLTDDKGEQRQIQEHAEKYIFILLPNQGLVSLQAKKVSGLPPRKVLESRFTELMRFAFFKSQISFTDIVRVEDGPSREEYVDEFYADKTLRVTMVRLRDFSELLPEGFKFFNPNYELNQWFRRGNEDDRRQLAEVMLVANQGGDLKHSPTARGLMSSSHDPREMRTITAGGRRRLRTREEQMVQVELKTDQSAPLSEDDVELLSQVTAVPARASLKQPNQVRPQNSSNRAEQLFPEEQSL